MEDKLVIDRFADEADTATAIAEMEIADALLAHQQSAKVVELKATGYCHYCEAELSEEGALFCDSECQVEYKQEQAQKDFLKKIGALH